VTAEYTKHFIDVSKIIIIVCTSAVVFSAENQEFNDVLLHNIYQYVQYIVIVRVRSFMQLKSIKYAKNMQNDFFFYKLTIYN
jgi:hypothetical protein